MPPVEAAPTEGKISGTPSSGPVVDADTLKKFGEAVEADGLYPAKVAAEPAAPPAEPPPKVETPPVEPLPPDPAAPPAEPTPPADPLKDAQAKVAEYERQLAQVQEQQDVNARAAAGAYLQKVAAEQPWLAPYIYGEKDPAKEPPTPPAAAPKPGDPAPDPNVARFAALEAEAKANREWRQQQERVQILDDIQSKAEVAMKKFNVFAETHPASKVGYELVAHILKREPKTPIESVVERVGKHLQGMEEAIKAQYTTVKKAASVKVAPGVGAGAPPAPPGNAPLKYSIGSNALPKAMAAAMDAAMGRGNS